MPHQRANVIQIRYGLCSIARQHLLGLMACVLVDQSTHITDCTIEQAIRTHNGQSSLVPSVRSFPSNPAEAKYAESSFCVCLYFKKISIFPLYWQEKLKLELDTLVCRAQRNIWKYSFGIKAWEIWQMKGKYTKKHSSCDCSSAYMLLHGCNDARQPLESSTSLLKR